MGSRYENDWTGEAVWRPPALHLGSLRLLLNPAVDETHRNAEAVGGPPAQHLGSLRSLRRRATPRKRWGRETSYPMDLYQRVHGQRAQARRCNKSPV